MNSTIIKPDHTHTVTAYVSDASARVYSGDYQGARDHMAKAIKSARKRNRYIVYLPTTALALPCAIISARVDTPAYSLRLEAITR